MKFHLNHNNLIKFDVHIWYKRDLLDPLLV